MTECFGISSISNICMPSLKRSFNVAIKKNTLILQRSYVKIQDIRPIQGSNRRQDSGFHTLDLDSLSVNLDSGFQIPGVSTLGGFFELNSGRQSPGFHIPPAKTSRIQEFAHPDLWELSVMNVAISRLFLKSRMLTIMLQTSVGYFESKNPWSSAR